MTEHSKPLTDDEVHERLVKASDVLADGQAETKRGGTAITAARRALAILQFGLVKAMDDDTDQVPGVLPPDEPLTRS